MVEPTETETSFFKEPSPYQLKQEQQTNKWTPVTILGEVLGPLSGHTASLHNTKIWIFGGTNGKKALDRFLCFDTEF